MPAEADSDTAVALSLEDAQHRLWRGSHILIWVGRATALAFLKHWHSDTSCRTVDLTSGEHFPLWGHYLLNLPEPCQGTVLGPGVTQFQVVKYFGVPLRYSIKAYYPHQADFLVKRSDGSQVLLNPHRTAQVLYVDRRGPKYFGELARRDPPPAGCWGVSEDQAICRLCPELMAERDGQPTADVIATAAGMEGGLTDPMTNKEASAWLCNLELIPGQEVDLSDGTVFPWVQWIHNQPTIVQQFAGGVLKFVAVCITFEGRFTRRVVGKVFRMDRLAAPPLALLPGRKNVSSSELVTDHWGTYPFYGSMQDALQMRSVEAAGHAME
jgi:hypothetical protein